MHDECQAKKRLDEGRQRLELNEEDGIAVRETFRKQQVEQDNPSDFVDYRKRRGR